jgi:long-chain acyl-CoA synthetase
MLINKVAEARNVVSFRELIDGFDADKLHLPALVGKIEEGYWTVSYGEFQDYVKSIGNALLKMGVKKGDKIALIGENRNEWIISYLAIVYIGAIVIPLDILLSSDELIHIIKNSDAQMIFTSSAYLTKLFEKRPMMKNIEKFIVFDKNDPQMLDDMNKHLKDKKGKLTTVNFSSRVIEIADWESDQSTPYKNHEFPSFFALYHTGKKLLSKDVNLYKKVKVDPQDIAALIFTSGTTGLPKGVMLTHYNLLFNADGVQMSTKLTQEDHWAVLLPLHHTYPTMMGIVCPLLSYGRIIPIGSLKTNVFIPILQDTGASCIPAVPVLIEKIYKGVFAKVKAKGLLTSIVFHLMFGISKILYKLFGAKVGHALFGSVRHGLGLQRLRFFVSGGGPIPKQVIDGMEILGLVTMQGYGLSETSPVIASTTPTLNRAGSVGLPLINLEVRIDTPDENGNGEILVKGDSVMKGYYKMPDKTKEVIDKDGWLHTGDLGRQDTDGFLYITGRIKNIIVTKGGKNIYPEEIENHLLQSEYIAEVVVIGKHDAEKGEVPFAIIYPNFETITAEEQELNKSFTDEEIETLIRKEVRRLTHDLPSYKIPQGFKISPEELPKTSKRTVKRFLFTNNK